ncbi:MAG TPA: glycosyltransferase family 4 protein, partial [Candidatus Didemnitutus sp.]|nr:glycosyltransferase family 4 protein [Candidatus Didemnitutus sp.]
DSHAVGTHPDIPVGPFRFAFAVPEANADATSHRLDLTLLGADWSNFLAWFGRVNPAGAAQAWRSQRRNRRLRIQRVEADGEVLFDFSNRASPWNPAFARRFLKLSLNLVGYFRADLGIGESVRSMARAAKAADLPVALVDLKLPCKNPMSDDSFRSQLQSDSPHPVTVVHVDPPGMRDLDHHHGPAFRRGKYTIGYWAWELPEFPDAWIHFSDYCQEVWAPSHFAASAIAQKLPVPVLTMPHAILFARPAGDFRTKFGLPRDKFLFLFLYDLNPYSERKNPAAVIEAFRRAGVGGAGAALVIKVHNVPGNEADFERLRAVAATLPGTILITQTLSRAEIYELESTCDSFVSLHRSEGFGFAVAESMYLGKPVISTDWSGTAEFVHADNGCPVRCTLVTLDRNHGPYAKGQTWADPDIDHAAWWMRKLLEDRALATRLGAAARATIEERYSPRAIGTLYRRRLEAIAGW